MGIYDRDYMREPDPPRRSFGPIVLVVLFLIILFAIAYFRQHPARFRHMTAVFSRH
jgi:hypothetical protein